MSKKKIQGWTTHWADTDTMVRAIIKYKYLDNINFEVWDWFFGGIIWTKLKKNPCHIKCVIVELLLKLLKRYHLVFSYLILHKIGRLAWDRLTKEWSESMQQRQEDAFSASGSKILDPTFPIMQIASFIRLPLPTKCPHFLKSMPQIN